MAPLCAARLTSPLTSFTSLTFVDVSASALGLFERPVVVLLDLFVVRLESLLERTELEGDTSLTTANSSTSGLGPWVRTVRTVPLDDLFLVSVERTAGEGGRRCPSRRRRSGSSADPAPIAAVS